MPWIKKKLWIPSIALVGSLFLLGPMVWVPVPVAAAQERASGLATLGTVTALATPTEDATVTALNKEKLAQEVLQLRKQNQTDFLEWLRMNAAILLSTLVVVGGGVFGFLRYLAERRDTQKRFFEDRQAERERLDVEQKRWLKDQESERERLDVEQKRWLKDQESKREMRAEERFQSAVTASTR